MDERENNHVTLVFETLEIEPTDDKRAIKRAYAKLVKQYHPEEHPEKWKQIHDAYLAALDQAEHAITDQQITDHSKEKQWASDIQTASVSAEKTPVNVQIKGEQQEGGEIPEPERKISKPNETVHLFAQIGLLSAEQKKQDEEQQSQVLQNLIKHFQKMAKSRHYKKEEWENFFYQPDILPFISRAEFLYQLGNQLANREIDDELYFLLKDQLKIIRKYRADKKMRAQENGGTEPVKYAERMIDAARREDHWFKRLQRRIRKRSEGIRVALGVGLALAGVFLYGMMTDNLKESEREKNTAWNVSATQSAETIQNAETAQITGTEQNAESAQSTGTMASSSKSLQVLQKASEEEEGKTYQYLQAIKLNYDDVACRVFIPDGDDSTIEPDCAEGELNGIKVSTFFIETSEEKDAMMKSRIETLRQQIEDSEQPYQNLSESEALPMPNYLNAEYTALYFEKIGTQGEAVPMMYIEGYTVLKEKDGVIKEVIISMSISLPEPEETEAASDRTPNRTCNGILRELQRAYSIDLQQMIQ